MSDIRITLGNRKYTFVLHNKSGTLEILRYGCPWRDETGDNALLALMRSYVDIERELGTLKAEIGKLRVQLSQFTAGNTPNPERDEEEALLESFGWSRDCISPLEISHPEGGRASGEAARMVITTLRGMKERGETEDE